MLNRKLFSAVLLVTILCLMAWGGPNLAAQPEEFNDPTGGLLIAFVSNRNGNSDVYVMDATGRNQRNLSQNNAEDYGPSWSPDGLRIAFVSTRDGNREIYAVNYQTRTAENLSLSPQSDEDWPAWSPTDADLLAFVSNRADPNTADIYLMNLRTREVRRLTTDARKKKDLVWLPDGSGLLYTMDRQNEGEQIMQLTLANRQTRLLTSIGTRNERITAATYADNQQVCVLFQTNRLGNRWQIFEMRGNGDIQEPLINTPPNVGHPALSPDGKFALYVGDTVQSDEIYLASVSPKCSGGSGSLNELARLTINEVSDHSPVWQPVVVASSLPDPSDEANTTDNQQVSSADVLSTGLNQSFNTDLLLRETIDLQDVINNNGIDVWQQAGWRGQGQKVAVLDTGFAGLQAFIDTVRDGRPVQLRDETPNPLSTNDHGTRVLEVLHAAAPEAELYACRYTNLGQFDGCIDWAISNGVKIINHSAGLPLMPLNGTNRFAESASRAVQEGILWVNSAGNFAQGYVSTTASDVNADGYVDFGQPDNVMRIEPSGFYRGNVILSWIRTDNTDPTIPPDLGFDLEVIDLSTLSPIGQNVITESSADRSYRRLIVETSSGFGLRARPTQPITPAQFNAFRLVLFAEFLTITGGVQEGSVLAPGDAENVITVGAVVGRDNRIAPFSSFGLLDVRRSKPDLVAYGAVGLNPTRFNGSIVESAFIGTSAAAPLVAGAAALVWEANPNFTWDNIDRYMRRTAVQDIGINDQALGRGILQLPDPPTRAIGQAFQEVEPFVVFVTPTPSPIDLRDQCPGAIVSRLEVGARGFVLKNLDILGGLNLRSEPSTASSRTILVRLPANTQFTAIEGPRCSEGAFWWRIELDDGSTGWLLEGAIDIPRHNNGGYLIAPINLERAVYPGMADRSPCNAPPTQLAIGDTAVLIKGSLTVYQEIEQRREYRHQLARDTRIAVLGGPRCEGQADRVMRWYIRVLSGSQAGLEGWVAESITGDRFMSREGGSTTAAATSAPTAVPTLRPTTVVQAMTVGAPQPPISYTPYPTSAPAADPRQTITCDAVFIQRVNTRTGPGTTYSIARAQDSGVVRRIVGYALDSANERWYRLLDRTWVKADAVQADHPTCSRLSVTGVDERIPTANASFPPDRQNIPLSAIKLTNGVGLTTGGRVTNGEMELEGYCTSMGYRLARRASRFLCTNEANGEIPVRFEAADFDYICQRTYNNDLAFAGGSGLAWTCYRNP